MRLDAATAAGPRAASRFLKSRDGIAALEFAFIAPVMIFLFFAVVEGSNAFSVSRRVSLAVNTLADLTSQESQITAAQANDLFTGVEQIIAEGDIDAEIRLVSLIYDPDTDEVKVHWSRDNSGAAPYSAGSVYTGFGDATLLDASSSLIVAEIEYDYVSDLTRRLLPSVAFRKAANRWPRRSARVQFCITLGSCTS